MEWNLPEENLRDYLNLENQMLGNYLAVSNPKANNTFGLFMYALGYLMVLHGAFGVLYGYLTPEALLFFLAANCYFFWAIAYFRNSYEWLKWHDEIETVRWD